MPVNEEMIQQAKECLANTQVESFTASPTSIRPGEGSTLSWKVRAPGDCQVGLFLNGSRISHSGSRSIQPTMTTPYRLVGKMFTVQRTLGTITVAVDASQCFMRSVSEETVRQMLETQIETNLAGSALRQRAPASVEIDRNGIAIKLRLRVDVPNFWDPDLDISMRVATITQNGNVVVLYQSYANDLDWPWWVTGITLGITKLIEEIIENQIENGLKPLILKWIKALIDSNLTIPPNHHLQSLGLEENEITVFVCPNLADVG